MKVARGHASHSSHASLSVAEGVSRVHAVLDRVELRSAGSESVAAIDRAVHRLQALKLKAVAAAEREDVADAAGAAGTSAWLAGVTRERGDAAAGQVRLAGALEDGLDATGAALADGLLGVEHAAVIADAMGRLPADVTNAERIEVEQVLVTQAQGVDAGTLRRRARRALAAVERKHPTQVDEAEDAQLRSEEDAALAKARLSLHDNQDGTVKGRFVVPRMAGDMLRKVVQSLAAPRRHSETWKRIQAGQEARIDWPHQYGLALVQVLEHLPVEKLSGKVAATVVVTVDEAALRAGLGAARTDTGADLSVSAVRRLACAAGILPAVLSGASHIMDLGRTKRLFSEHQRVALATTYQECAAFGCDRPYSWSELHHENPWEHGGKTNLELAVPLCGYHHRRIHDPDYGHQIRRRETGLKVVTCHRRP